MIQVLSAMPSRYSVDRLQAICPSKIHKISKTNRQLKMKTMGVWAMEIITKAAILMQLSLSRVCSKIQITTPTKVMLMTWESIHFHSKMPRCLNLLFHKDIRSQLLRLNQAQRVMSVNNSRTMMKMKVVFSITLIKSLHLPRQKINSNNNLPSQQFNHKANKINLVGINLAKQTLKMKMSQQL